MGHSARIIKKNIDLGPILSEIVGLSISDNRADLLSIKEKY